MKRSAVVWIGALLLPAGLFAQTRTDVNSAVLFERYQFDPGLDYESVSQLSVPVTFTTSLGRLGLLTLSSGFTKIDLTGADGGADQSVSGIVDTEARIVFQVVPDRFSLLMTAVAPTGIEALDLDEGAILTALSSQVIGFSTTSLGTGGAGGFGFAGALPLGEMALGVAGSYTHAVAYAPVLGQEGEWKPGGELRVRAGLEGPVGPQTYLRVAGILASRGKDQIDGEDQGGVGNRFHLYGALNHGIGSGALTVYAFNSYRSAPQIETTAAGAVRIPKGNLLALGARVALPVTRVTRLIPRFEFRNLSEAPRDDVGDGGLEAAGTTFRVGTDLRHPLNRRVALVVQGEALFGNVVSPTSGEDVGVNGFKAGLHLEVRR